MKGARGLLISITGGKDLTLYEVDEAATRIREEVDPSANIILGATFDAALEGVMRVSVVATGIEGAHMSMANPDVEIKRAPMPQLKSMAPAERSPEPEIETPQVAQAPMAAIDQPEMMAGNSQAPANDEIQPDMPPAEPFYEDDEGLYSATGGTSWQ